MATLYTVGSSLAIKKYSKGFAVPKKPRLSAVSQPLFRFAAAAEKILEQERAFLAQDTGCDIETVVEKSVAADPVKGGGCTGLGIKGAEDQAFDPGVDDRSHAHDTGLKGDIEGGAGQAVVIFQAGCFP